MKKLLSLLFVLCMVLLSVSSYAESGAMEGTYTFEETAMGGALIVPWVLELHADGTYKIIEKNPVMGERTYEGTYSVEDTIVITGPFEGNPPQAPFFENDKSCKWMLNEDSTCTPVNYDSNAMPNLGGLPANLPQEESSQAGGELPVASADAASQEAAKGIAYASVSSSQVLDIHLPEGDGPFPVIVLVHGGGFMFGDQNMQIIQPVISAGVANGYAVVSVDYRKSSEAVFPAALSDVKAAVRFIRENAPRYGFDADHIAIWGESAGAYLSLMTALTPEVEELNGDVTAYAEQSSAVTALVDFYGPVEFAAMQAEAAEQGFKFGGNFECQFVGVSSLADEKVSSTYWETYKDQLPERFSLKAWIQVGDADTNVPYTQSVNFAERLSEVIGQENVQFSLLEGAAHEDAAFYTDENLTSVFRFLDECMK